MRAELGQERLADKIEVYAAEDEPLSELLEIFVQLLAEESRFVVGSPVKPKALDRVYHADLYYRHAAGHRRGNSRKVILHAGIFLIPR